MVEKMDQVLVSSWFHLHSSVPLSYVQPPEARPGKLLQVASRKTIPVIDLGGHDRSSILNQVLKASEEYGFFQVINHGVSKDLIEETLNIFKEFHGMAAEDKLRECSKDPNGRCKVYTSREINSKDTVQYWRDTLRHPCPPSGQFMGFWPLKPLGYRFAHIKRRRLAKGELTPLRIRMGEIVGRYTQELRKLGLKILDLLCEVLGLSSGYFSGELSENPAVLAHHYPPCPEPSLTLGAPKHRDPTLITILLQDKEINALQVFKDGEWIGVDPIPNAFVVNIGLLLQIITNGRLVGAEHRVVTNSGTARTTVAYFINPSSETLIEPAKAFINSTNPPLYGSVSFQEFRRSFFTIGSSHIETELTLQKAKATQPRDS